jgi:hypothetical protein
MVYQSISVNVNFFFFFFCFLKGVLKLTSVGRSQNARKERLKKKKMQLQGKGLNFNSYG